MSSTAATASVITPRLRRAGGLAATALALGTLAACASAEEPASAPATESPAAVESATPEADAQATEAPAAAGDATPVVTRTDESPTGYAVTFKYEAPEGATEVYLVGDPYFTQPENLGDMDAMFAHDARIGDEWTAGDISHPLFMNAPAPLEFNDASGLWEITTAMPAGAFNYGFVVGACEMVMMCETSYDPTNPPVFADVDVATPQTLSQIFVPAHEDFPTYDADYQGHEVTGVISHLLYTADGVLDADGSLDEGDRQIGVYLPPGYDAERAEPYQLLVLSHGMYDNETSWFSQGRAANTVEAAIATGAIDDTIVVTTNFYNIGGDAPSGDDYGVELRENLLPLIDETFNVSPEREDRAFGGLSMGGLLATELVHNNADLFGYYGIWSGGATEVTEPTEDELANLRSAIGIHVGTGVQDYLAGIGEASIARAEMYRGLGLPVVEFNMDGGHTFQVWREMLHDYLETVAFKPASAA
ncbi:alpha/beta hydrolase-fold protein [Demequina pelophila]|uniref:alpha/beta hydrolase-fold protein n=1 Tax=Demequina pelophila TaxID=1638984 RepID=UPI0007817D61|nr:alpha/beta hydrolase-fold protein [Demequina pelophila]